MTDRKTLDQMTSDELDQLYDDLDRYEEVVGDLNEANIGLARQAARAEAAITRVRALAGWALNDWSDLSPRKILNALDQPTPGPAATQTTDDQEQPMPAITTGLVVQPYRNDRGEPAWVFRCWGTDTCDGWLSLDHTSQQSAERARDRHITEEHTS